MAGISQSIQNVTAATPEGGHAVDLSHFIGDSTGVSYAMAGFIMKIVDWLLGIFGLEHNVTLVTFLYAAVVFGVAIVVGRVTQYIVLGCVRVVARHWNGAMYQALTSVRFFHKVCRVIPALVFLVLIQFTLSSHNALSGTLTKLTLIYVVYVICIALTALVVALWQHIDARENKRKLPLKGLAQLVKGALWIVAGIVVVAILVDKSPAALLAGLGAFATVLMLIFKDSILGLVAGVQLSENDSLHVGDWIKVDGTDANGTVQEVTLTSVKVLNWDKTTTTLPPYSLISGSFTNYRTMQESGTRRICRCYMIDADSVLPTTPQMLENIRKVPFMDEYITKKLAQKAAGKVADVDNPEGLVDGTIDTNLGLFRAYVKMWLDANHNISHDDDCFVSTLPQTASGIPFQVYCFTSTSKWLPYEAIQDTVFEAIASMLHYFQLYTFENPSGRDTVVDGYLSPGGDIDTVFGVPYPFFQATDAPDGAASSRVGDKQILKTATSPYAAKPSADRTPD
ncbi:MAG: mechanosensitive ion channel family protein [Muribaculaceae bacterium]|nr:mechanosensitive ion channel family protein [Muribaculaceae bacterium]